MKNILGVSIGTRSLKISEMSGRHLQSFATAEMPENAVVNDEIAAWSVISELLKTIRHDRKFRTKDCAVVLPDSGTYVRRVTMPVMTDKQLMVNLPYEFRDVLQDGPEKYLFDYSMIGIEKDENGKPKEMDLIGATVEKSLIEHYRQMFADAGLRLVKAEPRVTALADLVEAIPKGDNPDFALLDLGSTYTRIDIFHKGIYEVTRSIDRGVNDIVTAAAEVMNCDVHIARARLKDDTDGVLENPELQNVYNTIAIEVMRALNYYTYENRDNTLDRLYYCGSGSKIKPFLQEISDNISLKLAPLGDLDAEKAEALMSSPSSVGVALGE